ncbi:MAG TPA: nuclear transport factor 2 family protein [Acidimicrobiales bacterium]|nr:nuclear transport factor 2 family protein [Acidimicrobiales bacterium]
MDWDDWARRAEKALAFAEDGSWRDLFAAGATFADPNTSETGDLRAIQRGTARIFPDWRQEITSIRGTDEWAVFEWIGRATYAGRGSDDPTAGAPIEMHGATIVEVNDAGLVTMWRDYLDRKEPEDQIRAKLR